MAHTPRLSERVDFKIVQDTRRVSWPTLHTSRWVHLAVILGSSYELPDALANSMTCVDKMMIYVGEIGQTPLLLK